MRRLDFGNFEESREEAEFHKLLNEAVLNLCYELPPAIRSETLHFLYKYSDSTTDSGFDYFKKYYSPCYTILYWINENAQSLDWDDPLLELLIQSHSSALLLYSLDDHLVDQSLKTTHSLLQLRTQTWERYSQAGRLFAKEIHGGISVRDDFVDRYFNSVRDDSYMETLEAYLDRFRLRMATCSLQPYLLARSFMTREQAESVLKMYEAFGIAWRLLNDYQDLEKDLENDTFSSMTYFLSNADAMDWGSRGRSRILSCFENFGLEFKISDRINSYLKEAARIASELFLDHYANCLLSMRILIEPIPLSGARDLTEI
ncbi:hypothetical protein EHO60_14670 [Leptospira fletcheri]|uniref:Terpene synthase n=1 Tax=Leptospira fletcheri TaxID=2484981 RepID=A0A4R9GA23_9LEPT|nr:hypothetical protein [Leptospira fletcheri]TGK08596.1 hypothetical protein EHO60_14670 [Leptospira fletcheri]